MTDLGKLSFDKPFKTLDEQIELLKSRGMIIGVEDDEQNALLHLKHINYYHLAIYAKFFQQADGLFRSGTTFKEVLRLYQFDKKLRELLLDVLERIEVSLKATITYDVSASQADNRFWYVDENNFNLTTEQNEKILNSLLIKIKDCPESYAKQFHENYTNSDLPVWMAFEHLSFGECTKMLSILKECDQQIVAKKYSLSYGLNLKWLRCLSFLRNICAHHAWLWNRSFTFKIKKQHPKYESLFVGIKTDSLYAYLIVIQTYLAKINPTSSWRNRLENLINEYNVPIEKMGFSKDWKARLENIIAD